MAKHWRHRERDRAIRADFDVSLNIYDLVRKCELHKSRIRAILKNVDEPVNEAVARIGGLSHTRGSATVDMFLNEAQL